MNRPKVAAADRLTVYSLRLLPAEIALLRKHAKRTKATAGRVVGDLIRKHLS